MKISKKPSKNENSFPEGESNSQTPGFEADMLVTTPRRQEHFVHSILRTRICFKICLADLNDGAQ